MPWIPLVAAGITAAGSAYAASQSNRSTGLPSNLGQGPRWTPNSGVNIYRTGNRIQDVGNIPGYTSIDPNIRALREQTLQNLPGYRNTINDAYGTLGNNLFDIRNQFASNSNPYVQARVDPVLQQGAQARGNLIQGLNRRNIFGPLYQQSLNTFESDLGRQVGDAGALATNDQLQALLGIDTTRYNAALSSVQALQGLDQAQQSVAAQNLAQELAALGLSQADTGAILGAAQLNMQQNQLNDQMLGRGLYGLGQGLAGLGGTLNKQQPAYNTGWDPAWGNIGL